MSQIVELKRKPRKAKCPICARPSLAGLEPFCSKRCKDEDLRRWLDGGYRIPTDEGPDAPDVP
ncbi:MAG: DNA gyrase inhibitor YacG [Telmatospirillum sp.]|nr:DNA gyrase inhibitor YacG [Telmatospirillum sp.]